MAEGLAEVALENSSVWLRCRQIKKREEIQTVVKTGHSWECHSKLILTK